MPRDTRILPRLATFAVLTLIAIPADAAPDEGQVNLVMSEWARHAQELADSPQGYDPARTADQCVQAISDFERAGVPAAQLVTSRAFEHHPKAHHDQYGNSQIALEDTRDYCELYRRHAAFAAEFQTFDSANMWRDLYARQDVPLPAEREQLARELAGACRDGWDRAHAAGVADDLPTTIAVAPTFAEVRTAVCDGLDTALDALHASIDAAAKVVRAKWERAGVRGAKLELMIRYDGLGWRLPGGAVTTDPRRIAKAAVLYQWLEGDDPTDDRYTIHTVRTYRFKGAKVSSSEKTYRRPRGQAVGTDVFR